MNCPQDAHIQTAAYHHTQETRNLRGFNMKQSIGERKQSRNRGSRWKGKVLALAGIAAVALFSGGGIVGVEAMSRERARELREEAREMLHHGFDNYMLHAFPADEIKPLSCLPNHRTRPPEPLNLGLNDVLGNFSLTAIDTLSTLAIMAESDYSDKMRFWRTVEELRVRFYPREEAPSLPPLETNNHQRQQQHYLRGKRKSRRRRRKGQGRGFDIDTRVQVFEVTIRVLGGLLSAHLYAVGEFGGAVFPIPETLELTPEEKASGIWDWFGKSGGTVRTTGEYGQSGYDGHLLDLAYDLGERLLPALAWSPSGVPWPRVNLRHGLQFNIPPSANAASSDRSGNTDSGGKKKKKRKKQKKPKAFEYTYVHEGSHFRESPFYHEPGPEEEKLLSRLPPTEEEPDTITTTCPAGAASLVLEFTVLSRLTGDGRFEEAAKRAFDSVWRMRSGSGLLGASIDVAGGGDGGDAQWMEAFSGIGAGHDSFFEYALKSYILLSPSPTPSFHHTPRTNSSNHHLTHSTTTTTTTQPFSPSYFHTVWVNSHTSITRHLLHHHPTPHYLNAHFTTGATILAWIDSLSAFYPGLLTLSGHISEAESVHLFYTSLWARYRALPERWNIRTAAIDTGLGWWPGRPEFIESTYLLHQATGDEWYLNVGEMVLGDIKDQCWGECGWAGLQDVESAEKADRMESFVLGETVQYLFLLFDGAVGEGERGRGWLNGGSGGNGGEGRGMGREGTDGSWVFTTEGHPLVIPKWTYQPAQSSKRRKGKSKGSASPPAPPPQPTPSSTTSSNKLAPPPQPPTCENPRPQRQNVHPATLPFLQTQNNLVSSRRDLFHAAYFTGSYLGDSTTITPSSSSPSSPSSNQKPLSADYSSDIHFFYDLYPSHLAPPNGICDPIPGANEQSFDLIFPEMDATDVGGGGVAAGGRDPSGVGNVDDARAMKGEYRYSPPQGTPNFSRVPGGLFIHSLSNLRISFLLETRREFNSPTSEDDHLPDDPSWGEEQLRITKLNYLSLGRDEKVYIPLSLVRGMWQDENFVVEEREVVDFVVDFGEDDGALDLVGDGVGEGNVQDEGRERVRPMAGEGNVIAREAEKLLNEPLSVGIEGEDGHPDREGQVVVSGDNTVPGGKHEGEKELGVDELVDKLVAELLSSTSDLKVIAGDGFGDENFWKKLEKALAGKDKGDFPVSGADDHRSDVPSLLPPAAAQQGKHEGGGSCENSPPPELPVSDETTTTTTTPITTSELPNSIATPSPGFWTSSANELLAHVRHLQRELKSLLQTVSPHAPPHHKTPASPSPNRKPFFFPAILASGPGSHPIPDPPPLNPRLRQTWPPAAPPTPYRHLYLPLTSSEDPYLCRRYPPPLNPALLPKSTQILVIKRGNCRFSEKLANVPDRKVLPELKAVVFVDFPTGRAEKRGEWPPRYSLKRMVRPLLHEPQKRSDGSWKPDGEKVAAVMVGGGEVMWDGLGRLMRKLDARGGRGNRVGKDAGVGLERRYLVRIGGEFVKEEGKGGGGWAVRNLRVVRG